MYKFRKREISCLGLKLGGPNMVKFRKIFEKNFFSSNHWKSFFGVFSLFLGFLTIFCEKKFSTPSQKKFLDLENFS